MGRQRISYFKQEGALKIITINVSIEQLEMIEVLIQHGLFASRSEGLRTMLAEYLPKKIHELELMTKYVEASADPPEQFDPNYVRIPNMDGTYTTKKIVRRLE